MKFHTRCFHALVCLWNIATLLTEVKSDKLDDEIANALFEPPSSRCASVPSGQSTSFTSTFFSTQDISNWNCINKQFEKDVFEIEMSHTGGSSHQAWDLRIGKGGHISSFRGPYGEAIANQASASASWNDLVTQMVSVNNVINTPEDPNFVHQSGVYNRDTGLPDPERQCPTSSTEIPFYSPKVALECSGNQCSIVNWGQQAHVPTIHRSDLLYYTRFRDCGDGIIEYDQMIHHFGDDPTDVYTYFNTPWTGVRTSTFHDLMISKVDGTLEHHFPLSGFGNGNLRNLDETGGFTTFAEDLALQDDSFDPGFCVKDTDTSEEVANVACSTPGSVPLKLQVQVDDSVRESSGHSERFGVPIFHMEGCNLQKPIKIGGYGFGNAPKGLYFTNDRTGFTVLVPRVVHWCWNGHLTYFSPNVTVDVMNEEFKANDGITITMASEGKGTEQYGFTFVHGKNREFGESFFTAKSRIRFGVTNEVRDGTVWTTNFIGSLPIKSTYWNRKYFISDQLKEMEGKAQGIVSNEDTMEDVMEVSELNTGNQITLYMDDSASSFGAAIGTSPQCGAYTQACVGSSTPKENFKPLFYITCGSKTYIGHDAYYFAVTEGDVQKPYLCRGESTSTRAEWKLLGYFPASGSDGACDVIGGESSTRSYSSTFCDCNDDPDFFFNKPRKDCAWVGERRQRCLKQSSKGDGLYILHHCPATCDACKFISCKDVASYRRNGKKRTCLWANKRRSRRCAQTSDDGKLVSDICPYSCGVCGPKSAADVQGEGYRKAL